MVDVDSPVHAPTSAGFQRLTGGQTLVQSLLQGGVDTLFTIPGIQLDGFFHALWDDRDKIRVIQTRHEQATAYMADGYARVTGREGVCCVVPGPGLLNASAGLATAYSCNSPVLCVTGQIHSPYIGVNGGALHEITDQLAMIRSVTKHAARATTPEAIPGTVAEAFHQLRTGRPRPVEVEVPPDVLFAEGEITFPDRYTVRERSAGDPEQLEKAAKLLGAAVNPIIFMGGGIQRSEAGVELTRLAELLQAPVVISRNGRGGISDRHYVAQSLLAEQEYLPTADVVLLAGTRSVGIFGAPARSYTPGQTV
ncbi:MAG: thiamine pyrophosphate-binding protein, partial [Thermomicrobiales bacterium]|nr:thiamine pyrophosphate-binding protein [Thermomicrobiales bacterium]